MSDHDRPAGTGVSKRIEGPRAHLEARRDELRAAISNLEDQELRTARSLQAAQAELARIEEKLGKLK